MTAAVSILIIGLPVLLIGGSAWSLTCDRSRPFKDEELHSYEQVMRTEFHKIESWLLAGDGGLIDRALQAEALLLRGWEGWEGEPPPFE